MALADRALVVGIDRYPSLHKPLSGAELDATDFFDWVTTEGGVALANATLVVSSKYLPAPQPWKEQPAREAIADFFHEVEKASQDNNAAGLGLRAGKRLYLFFSGHGFAPALDKSGVLMANASANAPMNVAAKWWADRMYQGGWFDEVLLFQDACREPMKLADLEPPFLKERNMANMAKRRRFVALSAKNNLLSLEKPHNNQVRGVFSVTLMAGLRGGARDPTTGEITAGQLKLYLQDNMKNLLTPAELANTTIANEPDVFDPDRFVILGPTPDWSPADADKFPVSVNLNGQTDARILGADLAEIAKDPNATDPWQLELARGFYRAVAGARMSDVFEVTGALRADGSKEPVNVVVN